MHRMLEIEEILLNIFGHCLPDLGHSRRAPSDLVSLARACRAFKEPALDVLWSELDDLSPLSRCLPEVSQQVFSRKAYTKLYSFTRALELAELEILRSYARRVWRIRNCSEGLDSKSVTTFLNLPTDTPLFPSLRRLSYDFPEEAIPLLHLHLPSLNSLSIWFSANGNPRLLQDPLISLAQFSPRIHQISIHGRELDPKTGKAISNSLRCWSNLRQVFCPEAPLEADAFLHLSRIATLTELTATLSPISLYQFGPSDMPLSFPNVHHLELCSKSWPPFLRLLPRIRLPAVTDFTASLSVGGCPSKLDLASFLAAVQMSGMGLTIRNLSLIQEHELTEGSNHFRSSEAPLLELDDLRPCMAFSDLCHIQLDLNWNVGVTDSELLTLVSAWPKLEQLHVNKEWGWNTRGITPDGLARLFQTCRSLSSVALAIDTRGYTEPPSYQPLADLRLDLSDIFYIDVIDSVIEEESVQVMARFFAGIVPHINFILNAWDTWDAWAVLQHPGMGEYGDRWREVHELASEMLKNVLLTAASMLPEL